MQIIVKCMPTYLNKIAKIHKCANYIWVQLITSSDGHLFQRVRDLSNSIKSVPTPCQSKNKIRLERSSFCEETKASVTDRTQPNPIFKISYC